MAGLTSADLALMEREMRTIQRDFQAVQSSYGEDTLNLVIATGYISRLIRNCRIERYLDENHPEILREFRIIVASASLDGVTGSILDKRYSSDPPRTTLTMAKPAAPLQPGQNSGDSREDQPVAKGRMAPHGVHRAQVKKGTDDQMAAIIECRYRWLRIPANTLLYEAALLPTPLCNRRKPLQCASVFRQRKIP